MRMKFRGAGIPTKFVDSQPKFEEVRDDDDDQTEEFEPVADSSSCKATEGLTPEQKFARASDARNNIGPRPGRRRSE